MNATISRHIARALGAASAATVRPRPRSRFESSATEPGRTTSLNDGALLFPPVVEDATSGDDAIVHDTHNVVSAMRPARTPEPEGPPSRRDDRSRGASDGAIGTVAAHRSVQPGRETTAMTDHLASARRAVAPDEHLAASFRVPTPDDPAFFSDSPSPEARRADESTNDQRESDTSILRPISADGWFAQSDNDDGWRLAAGPRACPSTDRAPTDRDSTDGAFATRTPTGCPLDGPDCAHRRDEIGPASGAPSGTTKRRRTTRPLRTMTTPP